MFVVYAIYNHKHDKVYIGQTRDIEDRLDFHQSKIFRGSYTSRFDGEWKLIYKENAPNRQIALKRERQLKSFRGREFIRKYIPR